MCTDEYTKRGLTNLLQAYNDGKDDIFNKPFYVLGDDIGYIKLIEYMPFHGLSFEEMIVKSARVSYDQELKGYDKDTKLLKYLWNNHHDTPFEMCQMVFEAKLPLCAARQWRTYRFASFNEQSYRYSEVDEENEFYIPSDWRLQDLKNKQGSKGSLFEVNEAVSNNLFSELDYIIERGVEAYKSAIEMGVAKEMARFFLPANILYTKLFISVNLRNLIHFLKQRSDYHAQWEIRQFANCILYDILPVLCPNIAEWTILEIETQNALKEG